MNRPTQYIVNVDFAEKSINKIIGDIYNQLDLSLYVPYANLDGLDDLLYPDDFDGPITFIIQNPSDVNTREDVYKRQSPIGVETYEYDGYDRLIKHKLDGVTYATVTYDEFSRIANVQYPAGLSLTSLERDSLGLSLIHI